MNTEDRKILIETRLREAFSPTYLEVIDESHKHIGHPGYNAPFKKGGRDEIFQGGQRHFAINIRADCFKNLSRVDAHRCVYALFNDMIPDLIHALRINIL